MIKISLHSISNRIRGLTLDVCLGAFLSAEMARQLTFPNQSILLSFLVVCAIYLIYVIDHLNDSNISQKEAYPYKFSWIRKSQHGIIASALLVTLIAATILFKIYSNQLLLFGLILGLMVLIYYFLGMLYRKKRIKSYPKEWIIAFVFTAGIWGFYLLQQFSFQYILIAGGFFISMLLNTYLFSYFECEEDDNDTHYNIVNHWGEEKYIWQFRYLFIAGLLVNTAVIFNYSTLAGLIQLGMVLYLKGIFIYRQKLKQGNYGLITDAVLFFPVFYILL